MKTIILSALALVGLLRFESNAQTKSERFDYKLELSSDVIQLKTGGTAQVDLSLIRGGRYKDQPASLGLSSSLPKGVTVQYEPASNVMDKSVVTISSDKDTKPGVYYIGVKSTIVNNIKSTLLKVEVKEGLADGAVTSVN